MQNDPNNYRPISVLPVVAKAFEKLVFHQFYLYLTNNDILSKFQSGFRSGHSTVNSLPQATEKCFKNIDSGFINGVVLLDFGKAFDTVDHEILLKKLNLYGVEGIPLKWFSSYIKHRLQCCAVNGVISEMKTLSTAVLKGLP